MKIEIAKCKTCNATIAACRNYEDNMSWLKSKIKYLRTENVSYEIIDHPVGNIFEQDTSKCCGKKAKL